MFEKIARGIAGGLARSGGLKVADISILVSENSNNLREGIRVPRKEETSDADRIASRIDSSHRIKNNPQHNSHINLYPGEKGIYCCDKSIFVSIEGIYAIGKGHLSFETMLKTFMQHMNDCGHVTRDIGFISNSWDPKKYEQYKSHIRDLIKQGITFEAYFIDPESHEVKIDIA